MLAGLALIGLAIGLKRSGLGAMAPGRCQFEVTSSDDAFPFTEEGYVAAWERAWEEAGDDHPGVMLCCTKVLFSTPETNCLRLGYAQPPYPKHELFDRNNDDPSTEPLLGLKRRIRRRS